MERNLALYRWYRVLGDAMAWLPVFFLYFNAHLSLAEVLRLEAVYYLAVVVLEVPSGYFSDKVGRRATLLIASTAFITAYCMFIWAQAFMEFALGQLALAAGMAFRSGTDTAFLYDSLHCLKREHEYASREAKVESLSLRASALAVLLGGASAGFDLVLAYWISLLAAAGSLIVALQFSEPTHDADTSDSFRQQLGTCVRSLKNPHLAWLFVFSVVVYMLAHVPYEFYQPYLELLDSRAMLPALSAPLASGILFSISMLLGAWIAGRSVRLQLRFGLSTVLLSAVVLQLIIIAILGAGLHAAVTTLLFFRNFPMAMVHAPMLAAIAPRVATAQRATYLSLQGLADRLCFSISLALVSMGVEVQATDWPTLASLLNTYVVVGLIALAALFVTRALAK